MKQDPAFKDVYVLFLSARNKPVSEKTGRSTGGDDFLAKPFDPKDLRAKVKKALGME